MAASSGATSSAARCSSTSASSQRPSANRARPAVAVRNGLCHRPSDVVDLADRLRDAPSLHKLLDARLEVAQEGEIHAQDTARIPLLGEGAHLTGDCDRLLAQALRFAIVT